MAQSARPLPLAPAIVGTYTGNGTEQTVVVGVQPTRLRIWNTTGDIELYEYIRGQKINTAFKQSSARTTRGVLDALHVSKGMKTLCEEVVIFDATPGGNPIYLKYNIAGTPYLASNLATALANKLLAPLHTRIVHDVAAATGAFQIYMDDTAVFSRDRLLMNNTEFLCDAYIRCAEGSSLKIKHDPDAATIGSALNYDDGGDDRLECDLSKAADEKVKSSGDQWMYPQDEVSNMSTVRGNVNVTTRSNIMLIDENGIELVRNGFKVGNEASLNNKGEEYRYVVDK